MILPVSLLTVSIQSSEGTTHRDPLAMCMFAVADSGGSRGQGGPGTP